MEARDRALKSFNNVLPRRSRAIYRGAHVVNILRDKLLDYENIAKACKRKRRTSMVAAAPLQHIQLDTIRITYVPDGYALFSPTDPFPTTTLEDWQPYQ